MSDVLFHAHSGNRYLVLLAGVVALGLLVWGLFSGRRYDRAANVSGAVFTGLLDLQVVIGLVLVAVWPWHPMLIGHLVLMLVALGAAHGLRVSARRQATDRGRYTRALLAVVVPLVLIAGGILAIGRSIV
jgi:hypothetical protein